MFKLCVEKFSQVKEIASENASADFQNFCRLASKKGTESAVFFGLEGTLRYTKRFKTGSQNFTITFHIQVDTCHMFEEK